MRGNNNSNRARIARRRVPNNEALIHGQMNRTRSLSLSKSLSAAARPSAPVESDTLREARAKAGLDWFSFFCANLQTGFGPFVSVYLTTEKWSQTDIGLVLMIGGIVGLLGQIPGGAIVDRARSKTLIAAAAVVLIGISALLVASGSVFALILLAWVLHAAASTVLSPSIATVSLQLVGHAGISSRLGRNATFASVGSALAAGGMGACGYYVSNQAVFFITAALAVPTLLSLWQIKPPREGAAAKTVPDAPSRDATPAEPFGSKTSFVADLRAFAGDRALMILASSVALYYLANAAMLPLVGSMLTLRSAHSPTVFIAACIVVPQIIVAVLSPMVGAKAESWGRRPILLIGFVALPVRGLLLGLVSDPWLLVMVQMLDGVSSAIIGVVMPLIAADVTRRNGRFALAQGVLGTAMGVGASFSATIAGVLTDHFGSAVAFFGLTVIAVLAAIPPILMMPETRDLGMSSAVIEQRPTE
jgi:MFS family permease